MPSIKESMRMRPKQRFNKVTSSKNIGNFFQSLKNEYKALGRDVRYVWRKMQGSCKAEFKHFSGKHVERVVKDSLRQGKVEQRRAQKIHADNEEGDRHKKSICFVRQEGKGHEGSRSCSQHCGAYPYLPAMSTPNRTNQAY